MHESSRQSEQAQPSSQPPYLPTPALHINPALSQPRGCALFPKPQTRPTEISISPTSISPSQPSPTATLGPGSNLFRKHCLPDPNSHYLVLIQSTGTQPESFTLHANQPKE